VFRQLNTRFRFKLFHWRAEYEMICKLAAGFSVGIFVPYMALVASSPLKSKRGDSDDRRARSKLCALDHDWLRDSEGRSVRRIPDLGQQPFCNRHGGPTERGQPTEHCDGDCGQIADREQPVLRSGPPDGGCLYRHNFR
jgi:hypothetical protein